MQIGEGKTLGIVFTIRLNSCLKISDKPVEWSIITNS